ncbi:MAG: pyridoxine 5'-phosphate synthase [Phycisphaeraceae bacterium]|nr:pyridoxine 5'-phosphate synthase [Phycisphaeraceae bacterium]
MIQLGVNIDHVATVRQARRTYEPDPVWAATEAQLGGADGITMHLREDRRHIQDHDVVRVKEMCHVKLNLEMAATAEMVQIACQIKPTLAMLVPEGRTEVTTEGGLNVLKQKNHLKDVIVQLHEAGMMVSAFIDADLQQIQAAAQVGFDTCEIHTGPYAQAFYEQGSQVSHPQVQTELTKVVEGGKRIVELGMQFNAGHALNYINVRPIAAIHNLSELHIGHAIVSRALFVGLKSAVQQMKSLMVSTSE